MKLVVDLLKSLYDAKVKGDGDYVVGSGFMFWEEIWYQSFLLGLIAVITVLFPLGEAYGISEALELAFYTWTAAYKILALDSLWFKRKDFD